MNRALARLVAARLLAAVPTVPGAAPSGDVDHALPDPSDGDDSPNTIDDVRWYETRLAPAAAIAQATRQLPRWIVDGGGESSATEGPAGPVAEAWDLSAVPGVSSRVVSVSTAPMSGGETLVRVDGEALWLSPRAPDQRIPAGVVSATFSGHGQLSRGGAGPTSTARTVRGADARELAAVVNGDELVQPTTDNCPDEIDESLSFRFDGAGGRRLASALESPTGCPTVTLRVSGGRVRSAVLWDGFQRGRSLLGTLVTVHAITRCPARSLSLGPAMPGGGELQFTVRNRARVICTLHGFPAVRLVAADGRVLVARDRDQSAQPAAILFPDSTAQLFATMRGCPHATRAGLALVRLPGESGTRRSLIRGRLRPCPGATLGVGAVWMSTFQMIDPPVSSPRESARTRASQPVGARGWPSTRPRPHRA